MTAAAHPLELPGLISFWDFAEAPGSDRVARGPHPYRLHEMGRPIARVDGGIFAPHAANLETGDWLRAPRADCPALNLHGPAAQVSVVAWIRRAPQTPVHCEAIAGMWNETERLRQYCLFLNLHIWESSDQVCGHVSSIGGPTPGFKYCMDTSVGATPVPFHAWQCVGFTYDGAFARSYLGGQLDVRPERNPYPYPGGLFDAGPSGSDFTVGAVHRSGVMGNWYAGVLGGLAIFNRALNDAEMAALAANIRPS